MAFPVYLKNGDEVKINDHVYCSPPWAVRDGTPYSVARIMEFLPPEDTPKGADGQYYLYSRVRLAWYYRPSDVSDRPVTDSRLLLAAIYSEVCDINQLRAKCYVVHRDKISDLSGWKKRPDRFYFNRLFDPYIKKEFEIIQATDVRNLPDNIREVLTSRYEYVVAEKEVIPDLTDVLRLCDTCEVWCPSQDSVQCDRCKRYFHMRCVQPPLVAKPSRGYGWTCAPCSKRHEEEVDNREARPISSKKTNAPPARSRGRPRKDKTQADREEKLAIKHFRMWPFRYFGQYTVAEDTLDPEDLIFPRAATRLGLKFQAVVPASSDIAMDVDEVPERTEQDERGGENTIEVLSIINTLRESEVSAIETHKKTLTTDKKLSSSVDWLTEVIHRFTTAVLLERPLSSVDMKSPMGTQKWKRSETRYIDKDWTPEEVAAFEDGIAAHGAELRAVREEIGTRTIFEVVRFYGLWKSTKLGEENAAIREHGRPSRPLGRKHQNPVEAANGQRVGLADEEASVISNPSKAPTCGACRTRESKTWWKAPKGLSTSVLCDSCGTNWRRYADLNVRAMVREESVPAQPKKPVLDKREGTPLTAPVTKRARTSASAHSTSPPAVSTAPQLRCMACHKNGALGKVIKCKQCQFRCHAGSCGAVVDPDSLDSWLCDVCQNEASQEAALDAARKPTEGQGWTHVLCSLFIGDLQYTDAARLRCVEGVSAIPLHRWDSVKANRRDTTTVVTFRGESGSMTPVVLCKEHDHSKRSIYGFCQTSEGGETALQVYSRAYKQAPISQAHGLLRKARRLDTLLASRNQASALLYIEEPRTGPADPECYRCHTQYSPLFYPVKAPGGDAFVCHTCHFGEQETGAVERKENGLANGHRVEDVDVVMVSD
ncbi:unnamed protein product [Mycena citricolor]|uniref:Uncharacterized protein n=1 Tax=Mycena citricolor TaxID=2018698 RepID=A0AAD2H486_9AGAR|nr:unnamed protein product [Mycena citricolor]